MAEPNPTSAPTAMKVFRVSTKLFGENVPRGCLNLYLKEVDVDQIADGSVWIDGHEHVKTDDTAYFASEVEALHWLHDAWITVLGQNRQQLQALAEQSQACHELAERASELALLTTVAMHAALAQSEAAGGKPCGL